MHGTLAATMRTRLIFILSIGLTIDSWGQTRDKECRCPANEYVHTQPETLFKFSNEKTIALCGNAINKGADKIFSEFVLSVCGQEKIIDFWDAMTFCKVKAEKDTIIIEELKYLATGVNQEIKPTIWTFEKVYFNSGVIERKITINKNIRKYGLHEIESVIKEYEISGGGIDDRKMLISDKLFIATISGDKKARKYFYEFKNKFGPLDGAFAEQYEELTAMLKIWDKHSSS